MDFYSAQDSNFGIRVSAIIYNSGKLLTIKREKNGITKYSLPGGNVSPDELCEEALERELREEVGGEGYRIFLCGQQDMLVTRRNDGLRYRKLHLIYHVDIEDQSSLKAKEYDDVQGHGEVMYCDVEELREHKLYPLINVSLSDRQYLDTGKPFRAFEPMTDSNYEWI